MTGTQESTSLRRQRPLISSTGRCLRMPRDVTLGVLETLLDQDLQTLRTGGGVQELLDRLRQQVGRLDIAVEELEGRNQRSALFKMMFLTFQKRSQRLAFAVIDCAGSYRPRAQASVSSYFPESRAQGEGYRPPGYRRHSKPLFYFRQDEPSYQRQGTRSIHPWHRSEVWWCGV